MNNSTKKKRSSVRNISPNTDGIRDVQSVKVKSFNKTSDSKNPTRLHVNGVSKSSTFSRSEQKNDKPSHLTENLNTVPKRGKSNESFHSSAVVCSNSKRKITRRNIYVNKYPDNLSEVGGNDDKENIVPLEKCPQIRSSNQKKISVQQLPPLHPLSGNKQTVPCYGQNHYLSAAKSGTVGKPSRKLVFQENPIAGRREDVYNFDEDDLPSKPSRRKRKRKKTLDSSDEEYVPSKRNIICKPFESGSQNSTEMNGFADHHKKKVSNSDKKSKLDNLQPEELHSEIKVNVTCDLSSSNVDGSKLKQSCCKQSSILLSTSRNKRNPISSNILGESRVSNFSVLGKTYNNDKKLALKPVVCLERLSFPTCVTDFPLCKSAAKLNSNKIETNSLYLHASASDTSYLSPKAYVERSCSLEGLPVSNIRTLTNKKIGDICKVEDQPNNFKGFMSSKCICTPDCKLSDDCPCQNNVEILCRKRDRILEPTNIVQTSTKSINDCVSSNKQSSFKNIAAPDSSNKENVSTFMQQSVLKDRRQSRKLWRPTAYVSPKAYVERNCSFEDSFDSSPRIKIAIGVSKQVSEATSSKFVPSKQDNKFCETFCLRSPEDVSSIHSGNVMGSDRWSACQVTGNTSKLSDQSECSTPIQLNTSSERNVCVVTPNVDNVPVQIGKRIPAVQDSDVGSSDSVSNITATVVSSKDTITGFLLSDMNSYSVSRDKDVRSDGKNVSRIEIRASRGMLCHGGTSADQVGECSTNNYFGFDQEEPEEELLSPIKLPTCTRVSHSNIATSSTPDHGTSTKQQAVMPWRSVLSRVPARPTNKKQVSLHSFLSKSAPTPQLKQDECAVLFTETETNRSLQHKTSSAKPVTSAVSTPVIFSIDDEPLDHGPSDRRQPARVYSHPRKGRKCKLESLQEEQVPVTEDNGENITRKTAKKRSKKEAEAVSNVEKLLTEINTQFEEIRNFELCVE